MRPTKTLLGQEAREAVRRGVNAIYEPVRRTFGPEGKNALLYQTFNRGPRITNDGVTVADVQEPKDIFARLAANAFKEGCKKTNERVGDGTTATAVIGGKLFNDLYRQLTEGSSTYNTGGKKKGVMSLRKEILATAKTVKEQIKAGATEVKTQEELEKIATVSVEDAEIGKIIAEIVWKAGRDSFVDVVEGYKGVIESEIIEGARFPAKIASKGFINRPAKYEMVAEQADVILTNHKLTNVLQTSGFISQVIKEHRKLVIFAPEFSGDVLNDMWNACFKSTPQGITKTGIEFYPVKVPSLKTEQFEDLAVYFGATFFDSAKVKLTTLKSEDLGYVEKLVIKDSEVMEDAVALSGGGTREEVITDVTEKEEEIEKKRGKDLVKVKEKIKVFTPRNTTKIKERIEVLRGQLAETRQDNFKKLLERRIASLSSAVGIIRVGDATAASSLYKKLKIEDGVYACRSALRNGYVKGGGLCLKEIADELPEANILKEALLAPFQQIQDSIDGGLEIGEEIIDPVDSVYYAVEHATQVVANLITVEIITPEVEDPVYGEGEFAIARALKELVISDKISKGQIMESQRESERDNMDKMLSDTNLSTDELVQLSGNEHFAV